MVATVVSPATVPSHGSAAVVPPPAVILNVTDTPTSGLPSRVTTLTPGRHSGATASPTAPVVHTATCDRCNNAVSSAVSLDFTRRAPCATVSVAGALAGAALGAVPGWVGSSRMKEPAIPPTPPLNDSSSSTTPNGLNDPAVPPTPPLNASDSPSKNERTLRSRLPINPELVASSAAVSHGRKLTSARGVISNPAVENAVEVQGPSRRCFFAVSGMVAGKVGQTATVTGFNSELATPDSCVTFTNPS